MMKRNMLLPLGGRLINLPCFFPSISTVKTNLTPLDYLRVLLAVDHPHFLISAYDILNSTKEERDKTGNLLAEATRSGKGILLDSGNYESFWKEDKDWTTKKYSSVLESLTFDMAFCFDIKEIPESNSKVVELVERAVLQDQKHCSQGTIIPIVHAPAKRLPNISVSITKKLHPVMIGIPERELGEGLLARTMALHKIRIALNAAGQYYPIHLLGTGHPLSILIFALAGADSFDALEWCKTTVDHKTGLLYHFQQREFLGEQTKFCKDPELQYTEATLAHNLLFYVRWMKKIQDAIGSGDCREIIKEYIPDDFWKNLSDECQEFMLRGGK